MTTTSSPRGKTILTGLLNTDDEGVDLDKPAMVDLEAPELDAPAASPDPIPDEEDQ